MELEVCGPLKAAMAGYVNAAPYTPTKSIVFFALNPTIYSTPYFGGTKIIMYTRSPLMAWTPLLLTASIVPK